MTLHTRPRRPAGDDALDALLRQADPVSTGASRDASMAQSPDYAGLAALTRAEAALGSADAGAPFPGRGGRLGRTGRRVAVGGSAVLLAVAGASVAAASPNAPEWLGWLDWRPDAVSVSPPGSCSAVALRVSGTLNDPAVEAARTYLRQLDITKVDYSTQLATAESQTVSDETGFIGLGRDVFSEQQLVDQAYSSAVAQAVFRHVEAVGLQSDWLSVEGQMQGCDLAPPG